MKENELDSAEKKWQLATYRNGDETELAALFAQVFGRTITPADWRWKLKSHDYTTAENVWLGIAADRIIFHYAAIPTRYQLAGSDAIGMVSVDTMTAPAFRRRGLLTEIGRHAYEQWRAAGVAFVIGLPNEKWGSRNTHLGWLPLFKLQWLRYPLRPAKLAANKLRNAALAKLSPIDVGWQRWQQRKLIPAPTIDVQPMTQADATFDKFWATIAPDYRFATIRDARWVNWRFLNSPLHKYQVLAAKRDGVMLGYVAFRIVREGNRQVGMIADMVTALGDTETLHQLLRAAIGRFKAAHVETITTLAVPESWLYTALRDAGFLQSKHAFSVEYVPLANPPPTALLRNASSWLMTGADYDVI